MGTFRRLAQALGFTAKVELWPVEVGALVKRMRSECPAAAYLFAATIFNSKELLAEKTIPQITKLNHIEDQRLASRDHRNIDAGIGELSLRFVRAVIAHRMHWGEVNATSMLMKATCDDLGAFGRHYRDLQPRDRMPPLTKSAVAVLAKQNRKTVGEAIDAIMVEHKTGVGTREGAEEDIQNILAFFDVRDEMASGNLAQYVRALDQAIPQR